MILLECFNKAVEEILLARLEPVANGAKPDNIDFTIADYDGAIYTLSNLEDRNKLYVSISMKFFDSLKKYGAEELLKREYGEYLRDTALSGQCATLEFDLKTIGSKDWKEFCKKASYFKRNCFAAVFEAFFDYQETGNVDQQRAVIPYRDNETMYVQASSDRVTVIFSTVFSDPDDVVIGKIFMQALVEVRNNYQRAPQVLYSHRNPPAELKGTNAAVGDNIAYITFVLFPRHTSKASRQKTINLIHTLRNYLHYHIKCGKAYLHTRMRAKSAEFQKILNRAKID